MQLVFTRPPHRDAMIRDIHPLEAGEGNFLTHLPALEVGPVGDTGRLLNMNPREELNSSDDGLHPTSNNPSLGYCQLSPGGPGPELKVQYLSLVTVPSLMFTTPM